MAIVRKASNIAQSAEETVNNRVRRSTNQFHDPRFIEMAAGHKYKVRLIAYEDDTYNRKTPLIRQITHSAKNAEGKWDSCICPKTFSQPCPICKTCWEWYDHGTEIQKATNQKLKGKFHGYGACYVIDDSYTPENNGKIKLFHYVTQMEEDFDMKIDGITRRIKRGETPEVDENALKSDAYFVVGHPDRDGETQLGHDLVITVTKKGEYKNYRVDFMTKQTKVNIPEDTLIDGLTELKLDEDYYREVDVAKLEAFTANYILPVQSGVTGASTVEDDLLDEGDLDDDLLLEEEEIQVEVAPKVEPKVEPKVAPKVAPETTDEEDPFGDIDSLDDMFGDDDLDF